MRPAKEPMLRIRPFFLYHNTLSDFFFSVFGMSGGKRREGYGPLDHAGDDDVGYAEGCVDVDADYVVRFGEVHFCEIRRERM